MPRSKIHLVYFAEEYRQIFLGTYTDLQGHELNTLIFGWKRKIKEETGKHYQKIIIHSYNDSDRWELPKTNYSDFVKQLKSQEVCNA